MRLQDEIEAHFYNDNAPAPECFTVGDILDQLSKLPRTLPYGDGDSGVAYRVTVFNITEEDPHCEIEEID